MYAVLFHLLNACFFPALAQRSPTISYISQEQIKDIGGTVELLCSVQYAQDYPVLWMKGDPRSNSYNLPISTGSSLILHDSRFSLRYDTVSNKTKYDTHLAHFIVIFQASSTYTLQIKDIQETDAGYYQCQVLISANNRITAEVELQVRRPPVISDNSTRSLVVSEGQGRQESAFVFSLYICFFLQLFKWNAMLGGIPCHVFPGGAKTTRFFLPAGPFTEEIS